MYDDDNVVVDVVHDNDDDDYNDYDYGDDESDAD